MTAKKQNDTKTIDLRARADAALAEWQAAKTKLEASRDAVGVANAALMGKVDVPSQDRVAALSARIAMLECDDAARIVGGRYSLAVDALAANGEVADDEKTCARAASLTSWRADLAASLAEEARVLEMLADIGRVRSERFAQLEAGRAALNEIRSRKGLPGPLAMPSSDGPFGALDPVASLDALLASDTPIGAANEEAILQLRAEERDLRSRIEHAHEAEQRAKRDRDDARKQREADARQDAARKDADAAALAADVANEAAEVERLAEANRARVGA